MFPIDNSTAASSLPTPAAAGTPGFFTDGNPAAGIPATIVPADWFNAMQQEILNVLAAASIAPNKTAQNQLAQAITLLTPGRLVSVPTLITTSGTFTPNPLAKAIRIRGSGGGGAGGGASTTSSTTASGGSGGACGAYAEFWITGPLAASYAVTIGAGGAPGAAGAAGNAGGSSSFIGGSVSVTLPGGKGGLAAVPTPPPFLGFDSGNGPDPTLTGVTALVSTAPIVGGGALMLSLSAAAASGGRGTFNPLGNAPSSGYGSGGNGSKNGASSAANSGSAGLQGAFIVEQFA